MRSDLDLQCARHRASALAAPQLRRVVLGAAILLLTPPIQAAKHPLQEATEKWRATRTQDLPLATYLRPLVASDPHFRADSALTPEKLGPEMRAVWDGLSLLLTPALQVQFLGLSSDELRQEWVRRYWAFRDPTPTTPENERERIHAERVVEAKSQFAWKQAPGWDARGDILIQFGAPDSVVEEGASVEDGLGFVPGHIQWIYLTERWVVEFERPNPKGAWKLGRSSARVSYRPDLVARDRARLGYDASLEPPTASNVDRAGDLIGLTEDRERLASDELYETIDTGVLRHEVRTDMRTRELLRKKTESLHRFRREYEKGGERFAVPGSAPNSLWYVFDVDVFKGPPGRMRVEVHYQLNMQDLRFTWDDSTYTARTRAEGVLLDRDAKAAGRDEYTETIRTTEYRTTLSPQLLPGQLVFNVPEGTYRLGLRIIDLESKNESTFLTAVEVPKLDGRALALSDLQVATSIVYAGDDWRSRFVKNDRLVIPNPIKAYTRGKQLVGYYEIYGLALDTERVARYEVKYTIAPRSLGRYEGFLPKEGTYTKPFVTSSFTDEGGTSELVRELRVDVANLASDTYDLVLTVKDLVSGSETTARTAFSILN